jgi:signal peptidase I
MLSSIVDYELQNVLWKVRDALDALDDTFWKDSSGYVYVDGEEGDYGDILYFKDEELVYTHRIHGGDSEEIILTELGKSIVKPLILDTIACNLFK